MLDIVQAVSHYIRWQGWPETLVVLGPFRCNKRCRTAHAWSWSVEHGPGMFGFTFHRPHNMHDMARDLKKNPIPLLVKEKIDATTNSERAPRIAR